MWLVVARADDIGTNPNSGIKTFVRLELTTSLSTENYYCRTVRNVGLRQ